MKERPILFSAPMVQAILKGRKTQTRRVIKGGFPNAGPLAKLNYSHPDWQGPMCPYGKPGDRLWVRESWGYHGLHSHGNLHEAMVKYHADGADRKIPFTSFKKMMDSAPKQNFPQPADWDELDADEKHWRHCEWMQDWWQKQNQKPSIHMFRWASRITLEITNVRVERLQDISGEDAEREGVEMAEVGDMTEIPSSWITKGWMPSLTSKSYRAGFAVLWDKINGKKAPWSDNPWVWVVEFTKI